MQGQLKKVQHIQATSRAFAALTEDGSVVTWGSAAHGGDSESVQGRLKDGSVVTWGDTDFGGHSRAVQGQLKNVQSIGAGRRFFVAIGGRLHF